MTLDFDRLNAIARSWVGTPFRAGARERGRGVDCVQLVLAILDEWLERPPLPAERFISPFSRYGDLEFVSGAFAADYRDVYTLVDFSARSGSIEPADVVGFRFGRVSHAGLCVDRRNMVHVVDGSGVTIERLGPARLSRVRRRYRLKTEAN